MLTHGDVWGGNLAVDPETGTLNGLFDWDEMALDDRYADLPGFARCMCAAYAAASGVVLGVQRVALSHLVAAFVAHADAVEAADERYPEGRLPWLREAVGSFRAEQRQACPRCPDEPFWTMIPLPMLTRWSTRLPPMEVHP